MTIRNFLCSRLALIAWSVCVIFGSLDTVAGNSKIECGGHHLNDLIGSADDPPTARVLGGYIVCSERGVIVEIRPLRSKLEIPGKISLWLGQGKEEVIDCLGQPDVVFVDYLLDDTPVESGYYNDYQLGIQFLRSHVSTLVNTGQSRWEKVYLGRRSESPSKGSPHETEKIVR